MAWLVGCRSLMISANKFADIGRVSRRMMPLFLGVDAPFFSTIVISKNRLFSLRFRRFSRKKDPWKEWGRYPYTVVRMTA